MDTSKLEEIGLTKNQAIVYTSLLKLGSTTAQEIIKESGLHSSRVYESLEKLQSFGLAGVVIKDYKRYFQASSPKKLLDFINEKKEIVNNLLPELESLEGMKKEKISASIYKGKEGIKAIHSEMLKEKKEIFVLGGKGLVFSELEYFMPHFEKERIKKKIKWKILWDDEKAKELVSKKGLVEGKVLPQGFQSKSVVNIFGDKVAIVLWEESYPTAFVIENKEVHESFRKWFELIYKNC